MQAEAFLKGLTHIATSVPNQAEGGARAVLAPLQLEDFNTNFAGSLGPLPVDEWQKHTSYDRKAQVRCTLDFVYNVQDHNKLGCALPHTHWL